MKKLILLAIVVVLSLGGCADKKMSNIKEDFPQSAQHQGSIIVDNMILPLPEGEWKVFGSGNIKNGKGISLVLGETQGNKLSRIIYISRNRKFKGSFKKDRRLKRKDNLHTYINEENTEVGKQNGWFIDYMNCSAFVPREWNSDAKKQAYNHIVDSKLAMPINLISTHHIFTDHYGKLLMYDIIINPDLEGLEPSASGEKRLSDWNSLRINNFPEKVAFVEKLRIENTEFHQKLKDAFDK